MSKEAQWIWQLECISVARSIHRSFFGLISLICIISICFLFIITTAVSSLLCACVCAHFFVCVVFIAEMNFIILQIWIIVLLVRIDLLLLLFNWRVVWSLVWHISKLKHESNLVVAILLPLCVPFSLHFCLEYKYRDYIQTNTCARVERVCGFSFVKVIEIDDSQIILNGLRVRVCIIAWRMTVNWMIQYNILKNGQSQFQNSKRKKTKR